MNLLPVLQIRGPCRDYAFAAYQRVDQIASRTLALNVNNPAESLAVECEQHELRPVLVAQCGGGDEDISLLRGPFFSLLDTSFALALNCTVAFISGRR